MKPPHSVCEVLREHVVLETKCIDRMYLNVYMPQLQGIGGIVWYLRGHLDQRFASIAGVTPKPEAFVANIERFVADQDVELMSFSKHQRKDDITRQYLRQFDADECVLYVGRAQEKARVVRTERHRNATTGMIYPWVVDSSAVVTHYHFHCVDADFGPFFRKFCSCFPYDAKLCINGNKYAKCQLRKRGIAFETLDNGVLSCTDPKAPQRICDDLDDKKNDGLRIQVAGAAPQPFDRCHRAAGFRYQASILQDEFALTQVLDRPVAGRGFPLVADKIKRFANQVKPAAGNIASILDAQQNQVIAVFTDVVIATKQANEHAEESSEVERLPAQIEAHTWSVTNALHDIAHATKEQSEAGQEIAKQVDSVASLSKRTKHEVGTVVDQLSGNLNSAVEAL